MKCWKCGNEIAQGHSNCPICGANLGNEIEIQQQIVMPDYSSGLAEGSRGFTDSKKSELDDNGARKKSMFCASVGILLCIIGTFLPFFRIRILWATRTLSLMEGNLQDDGIIIIGAMVIGALFIFLGSKKSRGIRHICLGAFAINITMFDYLTNKNNLAEHDVDHLVTTGAGFYVLLLGGILIFISGLLLMILKKK